MFGKMPGDDWQKAATLRALYGYMYAHPGQEADVHGLRVRAVARVELRPQPRLAPARAAAARGAAPLRAGSEPRLHVASRRCTKCDFEPARLPVDRLQRQREQRRLVHPPRARPRTTSSSRCSTSRRCRATATAIGVPRAGQLHRAAQQRRRGLRRQQRRQRRRGRSPSRSPSHGHAQSLRLTLPPLGFLLLKPSSS